MSPKLPALPTILIFTAFSAPDSAFRLNNSAWPAERQIEQTICAVKKRVDQGFSLIDPLLS
jgi:hypothetical protein